MYEGVLSTGQPITPEYTSRTVEIKKQKGQVYDHVTLNDTNAFFEQMYAQVDNDQINIDSPVPYEPELVEKYGPEIYGLDDENREEYIDDALFPKVKQKVEEQTKLNF